MRLKAMRLHAALLVACFGFAREPDLKPAVTANTEFALALFARLSAEKPAGNLFFSPYSMSIALAMATEGARGETAEQMGKVLRFPLALRNTGSAAADRPWDITTIHTGLASLNERFNSGNRPDQVPIREKIKVLRQQLNGANREAERLSQENKFGAARDLAAKARQFADELNQLLPKVDQYELSVANALWGDMTYPFRQSYIESIARFYKSGGIFPLDFRNSYGPSIDHINAWVEKQTNQRITNLIPKAALSESERKLLSLVITNAVYFHGEWAEIFPATATKPDDFLLASGGKATVLMMRQRMNKTRYAAFNADGTLFSTPREVPWDRDELSRNPILKYPATGGFAMLELPYKGADLSMVLIVPSSPGGLPAIEKKINAASLGAWIGLLAQRVVDVSMPRFRLETNYSMRDTLQSMGMIRAFNNASNPAGAQFDGMSASQDPLGKLHISQLLHKAFVEVTEKGTEAAAATAIMMGKTAARPPTIPFIPAFRADRPFLFLIRDIKSGTILFLGRMNSPEEPTSEMRR